MSELIDTDLNSKKIEAHTIIDVGYRNRQQLAYGSNLAPSLWQKC